MRSVAADDLASIPQELLHTLKLHIQARRIDHGLALLRTLNPFLRSFDPSLSGSAEVLSTLAQWCESGYCDCELLRRMVISYRKGMVSDLSLASYVHLILAEGMLAMTDDLLDAAIDHFDIVLKLAVDTNTHDILPIAHFWKARCLRKQGRHEDALTHIRKARELQVAYRHDEAAMLRLEGLIFFDQGRINDALSNLSAAELVLGHTDDYVLLGNIQSTYARILHAKGMYAQAIDHYARAIELLRKRPSKVENVARAMVDMSFTRILVARQLQHNIDQRVNGRGKTIPGPRHASLVRELSKLCDLILADLNEAADIYRKYPNTRGVAKVHIFRGYLYLDQGELDLASEAGASAYSAAESKRDIILMAAARNLQCMVENAWLDEEVEGFGAHSLSALDYARDAVKLAATTQHRRLLAMVHIWHGLSLMNPYFNAQDQAREQLEQASAYMDPSVQDHVWEDLQKLRARLSESPPGSKLNQWASGEIGATTFRQLEQDFADLIIPKIWEQENRKISRVAARLSISPRKVRRVLSRLCLLDPREHVK